MIHKSMPKGLFLVSWDSYAGGTLLFKHPESLDVPESVIQQLQISHNFIESIQAISTELMSTLSYSNVEKQLVMALVLKEGEESQDFYEILNGLNRLISEAEDLENPMLFNELRTIFDLSQYVFKAREQVMINLANQITELKEQQAETKTKFQYLFDNETDDEKKVLLYFFLENRAIVNEIVEATKLSKEKVMEIIEKLEDKETIERIKAGVYELTL
jgi:uncharacterized membrane protein